MRNPISDQLKTHIRISFRYSFISTPKHLFNITLLRSCNAWMSFIELFSRQPPAVAENANNKKPQKMEKMAIISNRNIFEWKHQYETFLSSIHINNKIIICRNTLRCCSFIDLYYILAIVMYNISNHIQHILMWWCRKNMTNHYT